MSRYIDADKLYDYLMAQANDAWNMKLPNVTQVLEDIADYVSVLDGADVRENVHGHWVKGEETYDGFMVHRCSECEWFGYDGTGVNFCPNCGADMRGEE